MCHIKLLVALIASLFTASAFAADKYEFDQPHTSLGFSVRHLTISSVKGKFNQFSGTIMFDESDVTKTAVSLKIKVDSIDTDNQKRDDHLRSADFFDAAKYPEITFTSKRVEKREPDYVAIGAFTMHGVTKEIEVPFSYIGKVKDSEGKMRVGFEGGLRLNRQDYGISYDKTGLTVGNEVKIEFSVEAIQAN